MSADIATIPLRSGRHALVDDADYGLLIRHRWYETNGYAVTSVRREHGRASHWAMHRMLLGLVWGDPRQGDHINGNKLDNRRANLRIVTMAENTQNRANGPRAGSGLRGVYRSRGRYRGLLSVGGERHDLGSFDTAESAAEAVARERRKLLSISVDLPLVDHVMSLVGRLNDAERRLVALALQDGLEAVH